MIKKQKKLKKAKINLKKDTSITTIKPDRILHSNISNVSNPNVSVSDVKTNINISLPKHKTQVTQNLNSKTSHANKIKISHKINRGAKKKHINNKLLFNTDEALVPREYILDNTPKKWKDVKNLEDAKKLINYGVLLKHKDIVRCHKLFTISEIKELIKYYGYKFADQDNSLYENIILQSVILWFDCNNADKYMFYFLESLIEHPDRIRAIYKLVERALNIEVSSLDLDINHNLNYTNYFGIAVSLICELGLSLNKLYMEDKDVLPNLGTIIDYISTYLLSLSNTDNNLIRLRLLHYFAILDSGKSNKIGLNKVMSRFGHSVLEGIFDLLFMSNKLSHTSYVMILQFIFEILPILFETDAHGQRIIFEVFKYYMFKNPKEFGNFLIRFSRHFHFKVLYTNSRDFVDFSSRNLQLKNYLYQIGGLMHIVDMWQYKPLMETLIYIFDLYKSVSITIDVIKEILDLKLVQNSQLVSNLEYILYNKQNVVKLFKIRHINRYFSVCKHNKLIKFKQRKIQRIIFRLNQLIMSTQQEESLVKAS